MKTIILILTFMSIFHLSIYAKNTLILSFGQSCDIGEHQEIVFEKKRLLSLLQWPMYPSFASYFSLSLLLKHFYISSEIAVNYPTFTGHMLDSDYTDPLKNKKTLFSHHNAFLKRGIITSLSIGFPIQIYNHTKQNAEKLMITLSPALLFYFSHLKWHAKGGYTQYNGNDNSKFWDASWPKTEYNGGGIEYIKNTFFSFLGINLCVNINNTWFITLNNAVSPFLIGKSHDTHFDSSTVYLDSFFAFAIAIKEDFSFEYKINRFSFSLVTTFLFSYTNMGSTQILKHSTGEHLSYFPKGSAGLLSKIGRFTLRLRTWL